MAAAKASPSPPTLREIARRARVSHTTVSLSLRNHPSIPERTRTRIQRLADRLGYRSNVLVSALMSQVRLKHHKAAPEIVGFLNGGPSPEEWKHHSASVGFYEGARQRAARLGMRVEPFWLGPGGSASAATCRMLHARAIHGNLITPFPLAVYDHELDWARMICVGLGYAFNRHALHRATHNHFRGAFVAYERLHGLGYRRIGLLLDQDENRRVHYTWLGGYLSARTTFDGEALEPLLTYSSDSNTKVTAWLERHRPDAVIGFGPRPYLTLRQLGCRIPGELAYAALDVQQMQLAHVERVAGIDQNLPLIGATAIDILASQLYHNEQGLPQRPVFSMIEGFWVDGETAPPRPGAAVSANTGRSSLANAGLSP